MEERGFDAVVRDALTGAVTLVQAKARRVPDVQGITTRLRDLLSGMEVVVGPVRVVLSQVLEPVLATFAAVAASRFAVVSDPEIRGGEPVVRGTRVPVYRLAELKAQGVADDVLLADHPSLTLDLLRQALLYAQLHPRVGRPRRGAASWREGKPKAHLHVVGGPPRPTGKLLRNPPRLRLNAAALLNADCATASRT